jgi:hypothetical protein
MAALYPLLASGRTSAAEAGLALGVSKTVAYEYLAAMRTYGYAEVTGGGRSSGWQLPERPEVPEDKRAEVDRHIAAGRPSAGTKRSKTSPRLPTMASSTSTRTSPRCWRRSAG